MARSSYCVLVHALLASEVLLAAAIQTDGHVQKIEQLPSLTDTVPKHIVLVKPGGTEMKSLLLLTVFGSAYGLLTFFLLVALCVGGCLRQQDEEGTPTDRFWLPRFVATGGNLGSVSQIVYRGWVLVCYTLPSCLVFGIPVVMIILLIDHVEEVAMYIFVLTSVSGLCIVLNLAITGAIGLCRLQFALSVPPERSEEQPECSPEQPKVIHWVVLPQYKESVEIVSQTLESLCRSSLSQQMGVLLAMEARESEAAEKASALAEAFSGKFGDLQVCYHPDDLPQDPPGKASNCAFAFHWLLLYLELDLKDGRSAGGDDGTELRRRRAEEQLEMLPLNAPRLGAEAAASVMLTVGDADSVFHHFYFEELTRQFSASPTKQHIWQSPILHVKNFESSPAPVKVGTLLTSMNELAVHADPNSVAFPYSTYSLPLELARDVGGWDPEWISEDWHMGIKCMLMTFGQCTLKKHPLPICNYTPEDVTYFGTIRARWVQMRRHAMGFGDLSYIFMILPLLQVATRSPGCSSRAFFSTVSKAFPLLLRITSVHVTLGLLTVFGVIMAVLSVLELTDFIAAGRIDRIITLGREFQALLLGAVVFCGAVSACHFARAYQLVMRKLERQRTDAFVDWCRFCFYLLWAGPFFFLAAGLCSCLAAIQMLRGNMDYVVAPKPRPRPLTEEQGPAVPHMDRRTLQPKSFRDLATDPFRSGFWCAHSVTSFCIGRLIAGCSIGLLSTVVALYQSEVAPAHLRGGLTSLYQFNITLGILVAAAVDVPLVKRGGGWRIAIILQSLPALCLLIGMIFLPRSPRWLVQKGRINEAYDVLLKLREERDAQQELKDILQSWQDSGEDEVSWRELARGRTKQLLMVGIALQMLQQLTGMNALMYFGPRIFRSLSLEDIPPVRSSRSLEAVNNAVNCLSTLPALYLADRCGRRGLLIWGATGMICACCVIATVGSFASHEAAAAGPTSVAAYVTVSMVFTFVINFAYGWGPMVWVYCAEMFPLHSRSRCVGVTTMSSWIGNYLIAQLSPVLLEGLGLASFFVFAGFSAAALGLACWLPETRGVALEDIERLFDERFGAARTVSSKAKAQILGLPQPAEEVSVLVGKAPCGTEEQGESDAMAAELGRPGKGREVQKQGSSDFDSVVK